MRYVHSIEGELLEWVCKLGYHGSIAVSLERSRGSRRDGRQETGARSQELGVRRGKKE
ncbi:hypothetical protein V0288_23410 [Pannus brasiliensis CCIBt3594]|uniref:Uncharacterized protein n=1 Tax=Pannus brasiliensis CCIBt3594 TaxID=1427578 RepID=A0AAW9QZ76_9CHRO